MTEPCLEFQFPLSWETKVYVELFGKVPDRAGLRLMVTLLDAMTVAMDETRGVALSKPIISVQGLTSPSTNGFRRFIDPVLSQEIASRFEAKESIAEIARASRFTAQTISNHLKKLGLHQPKERTK